MIALVETDLRFGVGMKHGLQATRQFLYVKEVSPDGHHVSSFGRISGEHIEEVPAAGVLDRYGQRMLLGAVSPDDEAERLVFFPLPEPQRQSILLASVSVRTSPWKCWSTTPR